MATVAGTFSYIYDGGINITNNVRPISVTASIAISDGVIIDKGGHTLTLPFSAYAGVGKKISVNANSGTGSTVAPSGSDDINGTNSPVVIASGTGQTFVADGITGWYQV